MKHIAKKLLFPLVLVLLLSLAGCSTSVYDATLDEIRSHLASIQDQFDNISYTLAVMFAPQASSSGEASAGIPSPESPSFEAPVPSSGEASSGEFSSVEASSGDPSSEEPISAGDLDSVRNKGVLVIGVAEREPMDYRDGDGAWIGFDADLARAFAASLGVEAEFVEIAPEDQIKALNSRDVDCLWNGLGLTERVTASLTCSHAYCIDPQVVIVPAEVADDYRTAESLEGLLFAVESDSAAQAAVEALEQAFSPVASPAAAIAEVAAGTADTAVIGRFLAESMVGEGTGYADLAYTVTVGSEACGVGFRRGSDLAAVVNEFLTAVYTDGTMQALAGTYGIQDLLLDPDAGESSAEPTGEPTAEPEEDAEAEPGEDAEEKSEEKSEEESDKDAEAESEEESEEKSDEDAEEKSEDGAEEKSDEDAEEKSDEDSEEESDGESEEKSEEDAEEKSDKDTEEEDAA